MKTTMSILVLAFSGFAFIQTAAGATSSGDPIASGKHVFEKYCSKCHGKNADGRGRKAYKYKPMPTNFRISRAARPYMVEITKKGGKGVGRSDNMPDWGGDLTDKQIENVVSFLMSVRGK
jgi:mono/diheme cytochrome c family protein